MIWIRSLGLEYGADDYITKPFNILEVKARIKSDHAPRTSQKTAQETKGKDRGRWEISCWTVRDAESALPAKKINLTAKEFDVLELLVFESE